MYCISYVILFKGHHTDQIQVVCHFDTGGVSGTVHLLQHRRIAETTKLGITLDGLNNLPGSDEYGLYITEYPANFNLDNPCAPASVGPIYNPDGIDITLPTYPARCQENHENCAIGDLATRHSPLTGNDSNSFVELRDKNLNLYGSNTVIGRGMVLRRLDNGDTLSCCNIELPTNTRILRAQFNNQVFSGAISIMHPQYDYVDFTINENAIIMVDLERIDGGQANIPVLGWQLQRGFADETCSRLDPMLGQRSLILAGLLGATTCTRTQHRLCRLGDLTTKCGPLRLINNRIRAQCTDNQLALVPFSTLDRLVVSIVDQRNVILDCAQLYEQTPAGAYVNFRFNGVIVNLLFSQLSPYRPTMYRTYVTGLNGQASNIVVYDGDDPDLRTCSNLGNVLDRRGNLPVANPSTSDQYPIGELGPKMGGVRGKNSLHNHGLSSSIPLTGPVNIIGRPIAVLRQDGFIWGCGLVENYTNAPYEPPGDVFDYLDIWRPPTP